MYALVDCNNFYASCERVFQPQFVGKPIVVLSNNDGCIISRSEEAKALGIPMGAPEFQVREQLRKHNILVFSSNYTLYGDLSGRVMDILHYYTPNVENYSIDEAFLNFDGISVADYHAYGLQIRKHIRKWLGLPVCVGIAPTKTLSKMANRIAKKFPEKTSGVYVIDTDEKRIKALKWTKIGDVWGIGYRLNKKMKAKNILTAHDFIQPENEAWIKTTMGVLGKRMLSELQGIPVLDLETPPQTKKSIAITRSFKTKLTKLDDLKERVSTFATVCAEKLRKQNSCCYSINVFLAKDPHKTTGRTYYSRTEILPFATNSNLTLSQTAVDMLEKIYEPNQVYMKAGVIVTQIIPQHQKQFHLFEEENPKHQQLMEAIDQYHAKIGQRKIRLGNQDLQHTWIMNQNFLSKNYTTDIKDIITVKC
ncbi:Y-family DNA polymerase [Flavobacterium suncheonense]|uniref:SOS mutagenesis and repair protein UmuC n=1 Tax=Flavobacterium suncheonense GH29-5 = DSM 17707 TaxID=1121899 RepID=A0A0A2MFL9_9FLAO|nr:Y-family DNA polymerase [Flavobacterium suncheonense]KGO90401.1 SOS mutagenesis and repair protein UmuC [Flavobacterium suncheonense GH29-5 = DSM 17707]